MKYLIIAADDFGFSKSINEGIVKAHTDGIVTSVNLMPSGLGFEDALQLAASIKLEEAGAHLSLTGTSSVSDPRTIPTIVAKDGTFCKNHTQFFIKLFLKMIDCKDIYTELKAQMNKLKASGIKINNINSHEHIHMMPYMLEIFIELAKEYNIPSIRYLHEDALVGRRTAKKLYRKLVLSYFAKRMGKILKNSKLLYVDNFLGFFDSGKIREEILLKMLSSLKDGTTELVTHPGFLCPDLMDRCIFYLDCETELTAVTSREVKDFMVNNGIRPISYGEFVRMKR